MSKGIDRKSNPELIALIHALKERGRVEGAPIWRDIASRLERPARLWAEVNVGKLESVLREGETAVVPGKLLATGSIQRAVTVAAVRFSEGARAKVTAAGGTCVPLGEYIAANGKGAKCRIVG